MLNMPGVLFGRGFRGEMHHMINCWHESMCDIIDEAVVMHQHMDKRFGGKGSCSWCGVPRAICERWKVEADQSDRSVRVKMLGSEARFRGLQEPVLQAIIKHQSPILDMMATGFGKTLLFQLPAKSTHSGTTVGSICIRRVSHGCRQHTQFPPHDEAIGELVEKG